MSKSINTLSDLRALLLAKGKVKRALADMPPQIRQMCSGAEEVMICRDSKVANKYIKKYSYPDFECVTVHDLPAVVIWR